MPLINFESPDYQRMVQRTMASPLARTNPSMMRKLQATHTKNVMTQRMAMEGAVQHKMAQEQKSDYMNKSLGIEERGMGLKETAMTLRQEGQKEQFRGNQITEQFKAGDLKQRQGQMTDNEDDSTMQMVMGLLPAAYSVYEGCRRANLTDSQTADRKLWQDQMLFGTKNPNFKAPNKPAENQNLGLLNWE